MPDDTLLIDRSGSTVQRVGQCAALTPAAATTVSSYGLNPGGFGLLSWNLHRASHPDLHHALYRLASQHDLIAVQEARLDPALRQLLRRQLLSWQMSPGFELDQEPVGVLSGARHAALASCARRSQEPWLQIPKVALYTLYAIAGSRQQLLLVNLHGINFSVGTREFSEQLRQAQHVVRDHHGPLIVAGDFNTWSQRRSKLLTELTQDLGLKPVKFAGSHRLRVGGLALDHIFFRDLRLLAATSLARSESDHNPLLARFALPLETTP